MMRGTGTFGGRVEILPDPSCREKFPDSWSRQNNIGRR